MNIADALAVWAPRLVAVLLLVVLVALVLRVRGQAAGRGRAATLVGVACWLVGAGAYLWQWRDFEVRRAAAKRAHAFVQAEVARADAEIALHRRGLLPAEDYAPFLTSFDPAVPASEADASPAQMEQWLLQSAASFGLRVQSIEHVTKTTSYIERTFTLDVEGTRAALEQFARFLASSPRLFRVDDLFLAGKAGTIRVSSFSDLRPKKDERDPCLSFPADVAPVGFFSLERERQELEWACIRRHLLEHVVLDGYRRTRPLQALIQRVRNQPLPPVATAYTAARLSARALQVKALGSEGQECDARVAAPDGRMLSLRAGDSLRDGVVISCANDHVIVQTEVRVAPDKTVQRLLRLSPPQRPRQIAVGHDTTRIKEPLLSRMPDGKPYVWADGAPDYYAWLERRLGAGVTRENNAAVALNRALSGLKDAGQTFFDEMAHRREIWRILAQPWREQDCPACAGRLEANEKPLADIAEAVRRPRHFEEVPHAARASGTRIPKLLPRRHAANAFTGRGMLRIARGDLKGAADDALAGQRLAVLISQEPSYVEKMIGIAVRGIVAPLLPMIAAQPALGRADALELLQQVERLPPMSSVTEAIDEYERFHALDEILISRSIAAERGPGAMMLQLEAAWLWQVGEALSLDPVVYLIPPELIDWEEALRITNRRFDAVVSWARAQNTGERARARAETLALARRHQDRLLAVLGKLRGAGGAPLQPGAIARAAAELAATPSGRAELAELLVRKELSIQDASPGGPALARNESEALFRLALDALALAVHRHDQEGFPETLEALVPPRTPPPGYVLRYARASPAAYAMTAVPEEPSLTGNRAFCVDSIGVTRMTTDGTAPKIVAGVCDPQAPLLR